MAAELKILFVEDLPTDVELAKRILSKEGIVFQSRVVDTEVDFLHELEKFSPDIIISDYKMPKFNGMRALNFTLEKCPSTPFILLTGSVNEEIAVECMKSGATDYIIKEHIARLPMAVKDALEKNKIIFQKEKAELELIKSEERLRITLEETQIGTFDWDLKNDVFYVSPTYYTMLGYKPKEGPADRDEWLNRAHPDDKNIVAEKIHDVINGSESNYQYEVRIKHADGSYRWINVIGRTIKEGENNKPARMIGVRIDITERKRAEEELRQNEDRYRDLVENSSDLICTHDLDGNILSVNSAALKITGYSQEEVLKMNMQNIIVPEYRKIFNAYLNKIQTVGHAHGLMIIQTKTGERRIWEYNNSLRTQGIDKPIVRGMVQDVTNRKRAEEALLKLKKAVDNSGEVIFLTDKDGVFTFANPAFTSIYGFTAEEIIGKVTPRILKSGLMDDDHYKMFWKDILSGKEMRGELTNKRKDGRMITIECTTTPIFDDKKNIIGFVAIHRDITERKQAEEEISMLAHSLKSVNECVSITDMEDKILFVNQSFLNTYGYEEDELIGKQIDIVLSQNNPHGLFKQIIEGTLCGGWQGELWSKRKDGSDFPIYLSTTIINDKNNKPSGLVGVAQDITERKKTEENLLKLSRAVEQSPASVVITNPQGDIEYVNHKFCEITGYTKEEVIGQNPRILKSGIQDKKYYEELWNTILKGSEWNGEFLDKKKNGELYWESALISPLVNKKGEITHFVAVKEDITEKKKMIEELVIAKDKAEEMSRLKSNFLANMSHELRTPLNGIMGYADILASQINKPELIEMAQGIYQSGKRLSETLNFILDLSEAETDRIEVIAKDIAVIPIVKNSIDSFSKEAAERNLQLETIIKEENISVHLDEHLFSRILHNLLDNAIKFTKEGKVIVEIGREITSGEDWLSIKIKDTGIGIAEDKIDLIWDEFRQVSEGLTRSYEGAGLGLTISKKAVELMQGNISVESELGVGSTFKVKFPAVSVLPQIEKVVKEKQAAVIQPEKEKVGTTDLPLVLCVEDDFVNRNIVKLFLKNICRIETAEDGETALQLAAEKKYDLVLMDINLGGGMNGLEVVQEILKMPQYTDTPIIAVTAYAMGKDKAEFIRGGCTHYISKPFQKHELIDLVSSVLKKN